MTTARELADLEDIKRLKHRYLRLLDLKRWDELADCLAADATADYGHADTTHEGRGAILTFLRDALGTAAIITSHRAGQPEIDLTGPDTATGTWALRDVVIATEHDVTIRGASFYHDRYARTPDGWRIAHTGYERLYEEHAPRGPGVELTVTAWD